jgi:hypothetical protein
MLGDALLLLLFTLGQLLDLCALLGLLFSRPSLGVASLGNDRRKSSGTTAQLTSLARAETDIEDQSSDGNHVQWQAVSSPGGSGCEHTRIHDSTHAFPQVLRDTRHVALHDITRPHAIRRENVAQTLSFLTADQGNMSTPAGVVFNALNQVGARCRSLKVNNANPTLVTTTTVPDGNSAGVVTTTLGMASFGEGQLVHGTTFP